MTRPRHESRDIPPWLPLPLAGCMIGLLLFAWAVTAWQYPGALRAQNIADPAPLFPAPRLQARPEAEMAAFKARETAFLDHYGWVDRQRGIVHVPIAVAMRKLAADGIAGWPAGAAK